MRVVKSGSLLAAAILLDAASCLFAGSVTLTTSAKDNTIFSDTIAQTGTTDSRSNSDGGATTMFVGDDGFGAARRGLVQFDLSSIPTGATITGATLRLTVAALGGTDTNTYTYSAFRLTTPWGEGTVVGSGGSGGGGGGTGGGGGMGGAAHTGDATWLDSAFPGTAWTHPGGDFNSSASGTSSIGVGTMSAGKLVPFTADFTGTGMIADVQAWLNNPSSNDGWIIEGNETTVAAIRQFASREATSGKPQLIVTFTTTPEPASAWLLAVGSMALLAWWRRRR